MYKLIILPLAYVHGVNTLVVSSLGGDMLLRIQTLFPIPHMKLTHVFKYMEIMYPSHTIHMIGILVVLGLLRLKLIPNEPQYNQKFMLDEYFAQPIYPCIINI